MVWFIILLHSTNCTIYRIQFENVYYNMMLNSNFIDTCTKAKEDFVLK